MMKASNGFKKLVPTVGLVIGMGSAFYLLSKALEHIPLGLLMQYGLVEELLLPSMVFIIPSSLSWDKSNFDLREKIIEKLIESTT